MRLFEWGVRAEVGLHMQHMLTPDFDCDRSNCTHYFYHRVHNQKAVHTQEQA
jgi:hypothetical protein